jgi:hypothetical protein
VGLARVDIYTWTPESPPLLYKSTRPEGQNLDENLEMIIYRIDRKREKKER